MIAALVTEHGKPPARTGPAPAVTRTRRCPGPGAAGSYGAGSGGFPYSVTSAAIMC